MEIFIGKRDIKGSMSAVNKMLLEEVNFFSRSGHKVHVGAELIDSGSRSAILGCGGAFHKTFKLPVSGFTGRKFFQKAAGRLIKKLRPELVIGHCDIKEQDVLFSHNLRHLAHERIFGEALPANDPIGRIHKDIFENGKFRLLICNSELMLEDLESRFGISREKMEILHPGFDAELFQFAENEKERLRRNRRGEFGIAEDETVIALITSGDFRKRNLSGLTDAFALLSAEHENIKLFIAGKDNFAPYLRHAAKFGLEDKVVCAPAIKNVKEYYSLADIFVLPAHVECFGRTVLEAMYCRLPVVVSPYVGAKSIIEGEARSFILSENSPAAICRGLSALVKNPPLRQRLGELNHNAAKKYTAENIWL
jgi:UDP-glucose:(heptosyl)LPS alpha-1,3-glucosyltransferase